MKHLLGNKWVKWAPNIDLLAVAITVLLMFISYYGYSQKIIPYWSFLIGNNLILAVAFPIWWVCFFRKQSLSKLGIKPQRWLPSLLISIALALYFFRRLIIMADNNNLTVEMHLIANSLLLWEPLFVFGWLQIRYDRAFGIIPGIVLTALSFAAYHAGTYSIDGLCMLFTWGLIFCVLFRITSNILIMWPFVWAISSTVGSMLERVVFTWEDIIFSAIILAIQLALIAFAWEHLESHRLFPNKH